MFSNHKQTKMPIMSLFKKIFGVSDSKEEDEKENIYNSQHDAPKAPVDERFMINFKKNGGKFIYCENLDEVKEQFENILEENDWFESEVMCFEPKLYSLLDENRLEYTQAKNPIFLFASCENLIAEEGSVFLSSNQLKQNKPSQLPANIVILATTSQIIESTSDGLRLIKKKYEKNYPTNITTIKYFDKAKEEDFLQYGSTPKNLYLLLLEDF